MSLSVLLVGVYLTIKVMTFRGRLYCMFPMERVGGVARKDPSCQPQPSSTTVGSAGSSAVLPFLANAHCSLLVGFDPKALCGRPASGGLASTACEYSFYPSHL